MGNLSVEFNVTRLMFTGIKLKKKLSICLLLFFLLTSTAGATQYIVKPVPSDQVGASINGEKVVELEVTEIPYWQFLLWLAIMQILSATDLRLYPIEIIFIITGFKIADNKNPIDTNGQDEVYKYIKTRPGAYVTEIAEKVGLCRGTVKHHVHNLKALNKIEVFKDGGKKRYFETNSIYDEEEKKVVSALQNTTNQRIFSEIQNGNCNTNIALAREFGVSRATVSWYIKNLKEIGLIKETKKGRTRIYRISDSYDYLLSNIGEEIE